MTATGYSPRLVGSVASIGAKSWNACANPSELGAPHPFTRYEFFAALEESNSATAEKGWQPCHLALERNGVVEALLPLYLKTHSQGEYVFDHGWADAFERAGGRYYPKLQASVPFTPATASRLLVAASTKEQDTKAALLAAGKVVANQLEASSLHITFMPETEWRIAEKAGYLLRTNQQFHWQNRDYDSFEQFLSDLSSSKRKNLRKERAAIHAEGIEFDWLTGSDIKETHWDNFFKFYMDTGSRKWGMPYLTRDFFSRVSEAMNNQIVLIFAKRNSRYIAGALNFFGEEILFGRNWGCIEYVPLLHFETCYYQAIDFAIAQKLKTVEAGAQGQHKLLRGYMPVPTFSAHFITHPDLRRAVKEYLSFEREAVSKNIEILSAHGPFKKTK